MEHLGKSNEVRGGSVGLININWKSPIVNGNVILMRNQDIEAVGKYIYEEYIKEPVDRALQKIEEEKQQKDLIKESTKVCTDAFVARKINIVATEREEQVTRENKIVVTEEEISAMADEIRKYLLRIIDDGKNSEQIVKVIEDCTKETTKENAKLTEEFYEHLKSTETKSAKETSEAINWFILIGFVLSLICMILFVVLTDKLPIKKFLIAGGILSGVVFILLIGMTANKDIKVQNDESNENFMKEPTYSDGYYTEDFSSKRDGNVMMISTDEINSFPKANYEKVKITGGQDIGWCAFEGCKKLTSITIPSSVRSIGYAAFKDCTELTSITIPGSVKKIDTDAFKDCTRLSSVIICEGVENIGWGAFEGCTGLTSITIPGSVRSIGYWAFRNCVNLTKIIMPSNIRFDSYSTFSGCRNLKVIERR